MATISKASLQSVLAKVEELALPEGEYLSLCSILKKQFETIPSTEVILEEPCDNSITFTGKKVVAIAFTHRTVYRGATPDLYRLTVNGVAKELTTQKCGELMLSLYRMNHTKTIMLGGEFETTFREYRTWLEEEEEGDDVYDYSESYVMLHMAGCLKN